MWVHNKHEDKVEPGGAEAIGAKPVPESLASGTPPVARKSP